MSPYLLLVLMFHPSNCGCRHSFVTICDTIQDFKSYTDVETLTEVMIGSESGTNMSSVDLMHTLQISRYHNLLTLMIIRAVNRLDITTYAFQCNYDNSPLQTIIFYGNIMKVIKPYHFPLFHLKKMSLVNNEIEAVKGWAFRGHEIEILDLSDNAIEVVESESLPLVPANKVVIIRNNKITHIESGSFSSSLEFLHLDYNKLRYIQDEVFADLVNLKQLTLSHNNFNALPKIEHLKKLVHFDISFNAISSFKKDTFKQMDELKLLDLSNNLIKSDVVLSWIITPQKQPTLVISLAMNGLRQLKVEEVVLQNQTLILFGNPWDCNTWPQLKTKLKGHESECDIEFLSSGNAPYCINYRADSYLFVSMWEGDVDRFHDTVTKSNKSTNCFLAPIGHKLFNHIGFGCVA